MTQTQRHPLRVRIRNRLESMFQRVSELNQSELEGTSEIQSDYAKYICVVTSGYLEQAVKEIALFYAESKAEPRISQYVSKSWPRSKNMDAAAIKQMFEKFDLDWGGQIETWMAKDEAIRKKHIDDLVTWRNRIAHGDETNLNVVRLASVKDRYKTACTLVDFLETLASPDA